MHDYSDVYADVLAQPARRRNAIPDIPADLDLVVETADGAFCGVVVAVDRVVDAGEKRDAVTVEDRYGKRRVFPMLAAAFLLDRRPVTLVRPTTRPVTSSRRKTASGSYTVPHTRARIARQSRIWVEGIHDAALIEWIWGADLRVKASSCNRWTASTGSLNKCAHSAPRETAASASSSITWSPAARNPASSRSCRQPSLSASDRREPQNDAPWVVIGARGRGQGRCRGLTAS